jgi:hypothetical protein
LFNTDELDDDFTVQEAKKFILGMRNSKVPGHNGTLAAALKYVGYWG